MGKLDWQFVCQWYDVGDIHRGLNAVRSNVPTDVTSREFAEWLAGQYRLAMYKGIQLAQAEQERRLRSRQS